MCGCSDTKASTAEAAKAASAEAVNFKVEDMTCGHCAGTITKAIQSSMPGARVEADPVSKLVSVTGAGDRAALAGIIAKAGYTPVAVPA